MPNTFRCLVLLAGLFPATALAGDAAKIRHKLYVTNSQGDDVTIVDAMTFKPIGRIVVGPHPHGIAS